MKRLCALLLLTALAACKPQADNAFHGYAEGEFVMLAPTTSGVLQKLNVERGQQVAVGTALFSLDLTSLTAARDAAKADVARAQSQQEDLTKGERAEEIDVVRKQREQAAAQLKQAEQEYNRVTPLAKTGAVSGSQVDADKAALDTAQAKLAEIDAQLKTAQLSARQDQIDAAEAAVNSAQQRLAQAEKMLSEASPVAPAAAKVEDTFFRPGEFVAAGKPVVSLLPPENLKVRFFVPQSQVATLRDGQSVTINCDGCTAPIAAKINFVASDAEYTPPVIYSIESRQKLVFRVEAKPDAPQAQLRPGQPVDITLDQP